MPSLYEGFGIPVVEALHFGCPVVISKTTSLPEIAGNAGIYIDPSNSESIADGLKFAVQLPESERDNLIIQGKKQISTFSWERCAQQTLDVFKSI